jgi:hypothetical protein
MIQNGMKIEGHHRSNAQKSLEKEVIANLRRRGTLFPIKAFKD